MLRWRADAVKRVRERLSPPFAGCETRLFQTGGIPDPCAMDLFSSAPASIHLIDDAEGGIRCWPGAVDATTAAAWFEALHRGAHWETQQRPMYDRVVEVPRRLASYRLDDLPSDLPLADMLAVVRRLAPAPYTAAGLNLYRDGRDGVAMHHDKLHTLVPGHPIALLSLGAPRRMRVRAKAGGAKAVAVELAPGSVLAMSHASQRTHEHGIPKMTRPVGPRISVVFRVRPAARMEAGCTARTGRGRSLPDAYPWSRVCSAMAIPRMQRSELRSAQRVQVRIVP